MTEQPRPVQGHGSIRLIEDKCTSCMICARECPAWCIQIDSHTEQVSGQGGAPIGGAAASATSGYARARQRSVNVLDRFQIDWSLCMYCGICVEQCPFDALEWAGRHVATADHPGGLHHGREQLR
ncbi:MULTISPECIES: NADH-quinone oxidoreductase subunit I [unclassified Luteococcus]|uniref:NADH-quinone oxidoreductase subunit I n=1 Tax=unclassified Luteococcus TaxID=2639923 RepID=UPI00313D25CC